VAEDGDAGGRHWSLLALTVLAMKAFREPLPLTPAAVVPRVPLLCAMIHPLVRNVTDYFGFVHQAYAGTRHTVPGLTGVESCNG
jgi:hypothetical protein